MLLKSFLNYFNVLFHIQPRLKLKYEYFSCWTSFKIISKLFQRQWMTLLFE